MTTIDKLTRVSDHLYRFDDTCPGARGQIDLLARAPSKGDSVRRLLTAEISIDGRSQGPISEAVVTVLS